jgi:hypothetical protein
VKTNLTCHSTDARRGFSVACQDVAQSCFSELIRGKLARRRGELRGFAGKHWRAVEATVKVIRLDKLSRID